jgi:hypothetical protein
MRLEAWLLRTGLLPVARAGRVALTALLPSERRLAREHRQRLAEFRDRYGHLFDPAGEPAPSAGKALIIARGFPAYIALEVALIKSLRLAGYSVEVLTLGGSSRFVEPYYRMAGASAFHEWKSFRVPADIDGAVVLLRSMSSVAELLRLEEGGVRVGRIAVSTGLRRLRCGSFDIANDEHRRELTDRLAESRQAHGTALRALEGIRPDLFVFVDTEYSPTAELFESTLVAGVPVVQYDLGHKGSTIMARRYRLDERDQHPWSLSARSWELIKGVEWTEARRARVAGELERAYGSRDWFSPSGTQFGTQAMEADELRRSLDLDPAKKTAVIFSHIVWDAPVTWGTRLFDNYEEWLVETVRAACDNPRLNWLVKVHPANVGKSQWEGFAEEAAEARLLRERIGALPAHIRLLPADTKVRTHSLFSITDYCLTVRGTVGMEAARLGIPVLNAGGGRYDRRGFTMDPETREAYLDTVSRLGEVPRMTAQQQELADRYVYGYLLQRPLEWKSISFRCTEGKGSDGTWAVHPSSEINLERAADWAVAPDIRAFAEWFTRDEERDFFIWPDGTDPAGAPPARADAHRVRHY